MSKPIKHIHLYRRMDLSNSPEKEYLVFKCIKPLCSHYIRVELAFGKLCECNRCHEPMILDKETVQLARPHCQECIKRKPKPELDDIGAFLKESGK